MSGVIAARTIAEKDAHIGYKNPHAAVTGKTGVGKYWDISDPAGRDGGAASRRGRMHDIVH